MPLLPSNVTALVRAAAVKSADASTVAAIEARVTVAVVRALD